MESLLIRWTAALVLAPILLLGRPTERDYQQVLQQQYRGETAVVEAQLWDRTRVDLLTEQLAVEIDFAPKWAEAIGQCLYYATVTGRRPAIALIMRGNSESQRRYVYRCQTVCVKYGIELQVYQAKDLISP